MKKIKMFFVFLFAALVFATGCEYLPDINITISSPSSETKEYYDMSGVSFNGASYVYDGEEHSLSIEGTLPDGVSVMYLNNNKVNAGTYEVTAKFTGDTKNYYPIEDMKATLTIAKAGVNGISFSGKTVTYDGNPHSIEIIGELPEGILVTYSGNEQVNVGSYEVTAYFTDTTGNYFELSPLKATLTINKATYDMSGIKFNSASYTYDGIEKEIKITGELPEGVSVSYENNTLTSAGSIEAVANFNHNNRNYNDISSLKATLTITKADIEGISFNGDTVTYDGKAHSLRIEGKLPEGVYVTYINNGHINAGTYTVTAHFEDSTGNYNNLPDMKATLVINKLNVNFSLEDEIFSYDGEYHSLTLVGEIPEGIIVNNSGNFYNKAGEYKVVYYFVDTTGNYNIIESLEATLTIIKDGKYHDVTFTLDDEFKIEYVVAHGEILNEIPTIPDKIGHIGEWNDDVSLPITQDKDFVVIYTPNKYTITFDCQGGELDDYTQVVSYGEEISLPKLTKDAHYFIGWLYNNEIIEETIFFVYLEDIKLIAEWVENEKNINWIKGVSDNVYTFVQNDDGSINVSYDKIDNSNSYAYVEVANDYGAYPYIIFKVKGSTGDSLMFKVETNENGGKINKKKTIIFDGSTQITVLDLSNYNKNVRNSISRIMIYFVPGYGNVNGEFTIYESYYSIRCEDVYLYPAIDTENASMFDDFNRTQSGFNGDYDASSTNQTVLDAGLTYALSYNNGDKVTVADGHATFDATNLAADDYINFREGNDNAYHDEKYLVLSVKMEEGATLDNFRFDVGNGVKYVNQMVSAPGLAVPMTYNAEYPYTTEDGYTWLVIDLAESGMIASNYIDFYYSGTGKLLVDAVFYANENKIITNDTLIVDGTKEEGKEYYLVVGWWETTALNEDGTSKITSSLTVDTVRLFYANLNLYLKAYGATDEQIKNVQFRDYSTEKIIEMGEKVNNDGDVDLLIGVGNNINSTACVSLFENNNGKTTVPMGTLAKLRYVALPNHEAMNNVAISVFDWIKTETGQKAFTTTLTISDIVVVPERTNDN